MDDDKGTSLMILHSEKGRTIFEEISNIIKFSVDGTIRYNLSMIQSVARPNKREHYMADIKGNPFNKVTNKYCKRKFFTE